MGYGIRSSNAYARIHSYGGTGQTSRRLWHTGLGGFRSHEYSRGLLDQLNDRGVAVTSVEALFGSPDRFRLSRSEFCARVGLDTRLPIVVYAVGSPNFLKEHHGVVEMARRLTRGDLGDIQMLVRPHPIHDRGQLADLLKQFSPICDVPVVTLDYNPKPGAPNRHLVHDVNHRGTHFKPIAESVVCGWPRISTRPDAPPRQNRASRPMCDRCHSAAAACVLVAIWQGCDTHGLRR